MVSDYRIIILTVFDTTLKMSAASETVGYFPFCLFHFVQVDRLTFKDLVTNLTLRTFRFRRNVKKSDGEEVKNKIEEWDTSTYPLAFFFNFYSKDLYIRVI